MLERAANDERMCRAQRPWICQGFIIGWLRNLDLLSEPPAVYPKGQRDDYSGDNASGNPNYQRHSCLAYRLTFTTVLSKQSIPPLLPLGRMPGHLETAPRLRHDRRTSACYHLHAEIHL